MLFVTYPRTAVNFMIGAINMQTGVNIKYTHDQFIDKDELLINIVRDPLESIASWISLAIFRNDHALQHNKLESVVHLIAKNKYINMYNFLLSKKDTVFINYKDIANIEKLMIKLCDILELKIINELVIDDVNKKNLDRSNYLNAKYLITSKTRPEYEDIYNKLKDIDFTDLYTLYNRALDRCIKLDN
jgi:hypothetical protein